MMPLIYILPGKPRRIDAVHRIATAEGERGHTVEFAEDTATEVHVGRRELAAFRQIDAIPEVIEPAVLVSFAALEKVAVLKSRLFPGVCAGPANPSEGVIVVLVDDGAVLLDDAQNGADVVGEVVIEGVCAADSLGKTDPAVHAGQELSYFAQRRALIDIKQRVSHFMKCETLKRNSISIIEFSTLTPLPPTLPSALPAAQAHYPLFSTVPSHQCHPHHGS